MRVLAVVAHPDDETLGCGGLLARLAAEGRHVAVLVLGEGLTSRPGHIQPDALERLRGECREACAELGVAEVFFENLPDNRFDTVPLLGIVQAVERTLTAVRPDLTLTHHGGDLNMDHVLTHRAVVTASRPCSPSAPAEVWAFETPSATEWAFGAGRPFAPNIFEDVEHTLERKLRAMARYGGESRPFPHPRSPEALRALAQLRGSAAGIAAAEAFELVRRIPRRAHE